MDKQAEAQRKVDQIWLNAEALYGAKKALEKAPCLKELSSLVDDQLKECGQKLGIDFEAEFDKRTVQDRKNARIIDRLKSCAILACFISFTLLIWRAL